MSSSYWLLFFRLLALASGLAGAWLLWRGRQRRTLAAVLALALLCSGSIFMALRLPTALALATPDATYRVQPAPPGQFRVIPAGQLEQALQASRGRPVLLDFSAAWCSSCQVWQTQVFNQPDVQAAMTPFILLRIDATDMTPDTQEALDHFGLAGLPALLSFDTGGRELKPLRILGEMPAARFISELRDRILPAARSGALSGHTAAFTKDSQTLSDS